MFFINFADGKDEQISYITKALPESEIHEDVLKTMSVFPKEVEMYDVVIPKLNKILNEAGVKLQFSPKCLKSSLDPEGFTMEDLCRKKFMNAKRQDGLDMAHTKYALSKLAKFHAASAVLIEKEGPFTGHFLDGIYKISMRSLFDEIMKTTIGIFRDCVAQWDISSKLQEKIVGCFDEYFDKIMKSIAIDENDFNVLNHGDMWANNIMFQYDADGKIQEMLFVDLQMCRYGSPAMDLNYFIISSCNPDIKIKEFDYLIRYYYDELVDCLRLLKYSKPLPKLTDLHADIIKRGFYGVVTATGVMTVALLDANDNAELENFMKDDEKGTQFKRDLYLNPRVIKQMHALLPWFENKGYMDP